MCCCCTEWVPPPRVSALASKDGLSPGILGILIGVGAAVLVLLIIFLIILIVVLSRRRRRLAKGLYKSSAHDNPTYMNHRDINANLAAAGASSPVALMFNDDGAIGASFFADDDKKKVNNCRRWMVLNDQLVLYTRIFVVNICCLSSLCAWNKDWLIEIPVKNHADYHKSLQGRRRMSNGGEGGMTVCLLSLTTSPRSNVIVAEIIFLVPGRPQEFFHGLEN